jgi:hypothetical protein
MCGKCLHYSGAVPADSPESAWVAIQALGWTLYRQGYALCPTCTADPPNVDKDAAQAMRRRKRPARRTPIFRGDGPCLLFFSSIHRPARISRGSGRSLGSLLASEHPELKHPVARDGIAPLEDRQQRFHARLQSRRPECIDDHLTAATSKSKQELKNVICATDDSWLLGQKSVEAGLGVTLPTVHSRPPHRIRRRTGQMITSIRRKAYAAPSVS